MSSYREIKHPRKVFHKNSLMVLGVCGGGSILLEPLCPRLDSIISCSSFLVSFWMVELFKHSTLVDLVNCDCSAIIIFKKDPMMPSQPMLPTPLP